MAEDKQYTLDELKAFYNVDKLPLINLYKERFKASVESYISQDGLFYVHSELVHKSIKAIVSSYKIKYSNVCLFAHCFEENIDLLNGKLSIDSFDDLYFIESSDHIKIGRSRNIKTRLSSLQVDNPDKLKLLLLKNCSGNNEHAIHRMFKYLRVNGEWFKKHEDIYNYIELTKQYPNNQNENWGTCKTYDTNDLMRDL